jgi:hypothetical protein
MNQTTPLNADRVDDLRDADLRSFNAAVGNESDPTMLVLRTHLFSENLLERLIRLKITRGDKIIEGGSLTYAQKLILVEALEALPDPISSSLRGLNKLRNQCAHELGRALSDADVVRIGSPLGHFFTQTHREAKYDPIKTLSGVASYLAGYIIGACHAYEEARVEGQSLLRAPCTKKEFALPASAPHTQLSYKDQPDA